MTLDDRPPVKAFACPIVEGLRCPAAPCPGAGSRRTCEHLARLGAWRSLGPVEQASRLESRPRIDPATRDAVNACPHRGPVLPLSKQDDCGCRGAELSECRADRGLIPGRVTLRDCLECKGGPA